jgi:hypothetical protein
MSASQILKKEWMKVETKVFYMQSLIWRAPDLEQFVNKLRERESQMGSRLSYPRKTGIQSTHYPSARCPKKFVTPYFHDKR